MKKNFIIHYEVYPFDVMVSIGETREEVIRQIEKRGYELTPKEKESLRMEGVGRTVMFEWGATVLRLKSFHPNDPELYGYLAHEVFHAVCFLLYKIGCGVKQKNDEAAAYLIAFLTRKILEEIRGKQKHHGKPARKNHQNRTDRSY